MVERRIVQICRETRNEIEQKMISNKHRKGFEGFVRFDIACNNNNDGKI